MKNRSNSSRKAMTLAEICVVLAVIAIVSTVVASFCLMANHRAVASSNRMQILNEVNAIEKIVEQFVDANTTVSIKNGALTAEDNKISFVDGVLTATMRDGEDPILLDCEAVDSISFELMPKSSDMLVFCEVTCTLPLANGERETETYVFCVNSRLGEEVAP